MGAPSPFTPEQMPRGARAARLLRPPRQRHHEPCTAGRRARANDLSAAGAFSETNRYDTVPDGHVSGLGKVRHREFVMAAGEMTREAFTEFLTVALERMKESSHPGSVAYVCMDWRHIGELLDAARSTSLDMLNLCVWTKPNAGMGSFYRSQHELVFVTQSWTRPPSQQRPIGRLWPEPQQRLGLCRRPWLWPGGRRGTSRRLASDGQTDGDGR